MDELRPTDTTGAPRSRLRRAGAALAALVALAGFAGLVLYAYERGRQVGGGDLPPLVKASPSPHKIKPAQPGGMDVPNRDKQVYDRLDPSRAKQPPERLLPGPETPRPPPESTSAPAPEPPPPAASKPADAAAAPAAPPQPPPASQPRKPKAKSAAASAVPAGGGRYRIQLASVRAQAAADGIWKRLRKVHADLLGRLEPKIVRRDFGKPRGVFYRVQAGPFASAAAARRICDRLKRRRADCIVVRP